MQTTATLTKNTLKVDKWMAWAAVYMAVIFVFTWLEVEVNAIVIALYFVLACPFILKPEVYLLVCTSFSLIAYFFCGADEGIYSIYTILMVICVLHFAFVQRTFKMAFAMAALGFILAVLTFISYKHSAYRYTNGLYALIYVIVTAIAVSSFINGKDNAVGAYWPGIAALFFTFCVISCIIGGGGETARFSISPDVNYNTFGMAMGQLSIVFSTQYFIISERKGKRYLLLWLAALLLVLLSGSRSALLGALGATLVVQIVYNYYNKRAIRFLLITLIAGTVVVLLALPLLKFLGMDLSRFNYQDVVDSGGSNRIELWNTLIPYITRNYLEHGVGPGHYCTSQVIYKLLRLRYSHSHNLLLEALCELGIGGCAVFLVLLVATVNRGIRVARNNLSMFVPLGCFVGLLINGIGEAYFCDMILWILMGIIFSFEKGTSKKEKGHEV